MIEYDMRVYDTTWYDMIWYDMIWYDEVECITLGYSSTNKKEQICIPKCIYIFPCIVYYNKDILPLRYKKG